MANRVVETDQVVQSLAKHSGTDTMLNATKVETETNDANQTSRSKNQQLSHHLSWPNIAVVSPCTRTETTSNLDYEKTLIKLMQKLRTAFCGRPFVSLLSSETQDAYCK